MKRLIICGLIGLTQVLCLATEPLGFADSQSGPDASSLLRLRTFAQSVGADVKNSKVAVTESGHYNLPNGYDTFLNSFASQGAQVLCFPWSDEMTFGYDSASWQIDSWLWHRLLRAMGGRGQRVPAAAILGRG